MGRQKSTNCFTQKVGGKKKPMRVRDYINRFSLLISLVLPPRH